MNIYIPKHIRKIGVVSKMCELIEKYAESGMYVDNMLDSFNDYYYYLNTDPVNRFLHFCIPETTWNETHPNEDYESCISYLSRLFYSVKGTFQVLEFMKSYLGLDIEYKYTVKNLKLTIKEITLTEIDEKVYYDSLVDFLKALLYFQNVEIKIELIKLHLGNTLHNFTGAHIVTYKEYTTVRYDNR
jgi:hypothetical protein